MYREEFFVETNSHEEAINITNKIQEIVSRSGVKNGLCNIYVPHATAGLIINEDADPNVMIDLFNALRKSIPNHAGWLHDRIDNNAAAHIKSSITSCSVNIPIIDGKPGLGTWQGVMLLEFDGPRRRRVIVTIIS
ncbi:YjbQ family protein [Candidatus Woesearchaeota archaeon]|nr:YjbQ family protein [Candidatus Woesearchaeota archaeon]